MVKNKPNRPLNRLINHFNKDAPTSDTQHLTISPCPDRGTVIGRHEISCNLGNLLLGDGLRKALRVAVENTL
jgi:hypothetical protein